MGREGVGDEMEGVTSGKVLNFGGVEVQLSIFGPATTYSHEPWDIPFLLRHVME